MQKNEKKEHRYDIIIYSDTVSSAIKSQISRSQSPDLRSIVDNYEKNIKSKFLAEDYAKNTVIFQMSMTGILFNNQNLRILPSDPLRKAFQGSDGKIVVLLDDHVEIQTLLRKVDCAEIPVKCSKEKDVFFPSEKSLRSLVGKSKVSITNDVARLVDHPEFAFAYMWSGEALAKLDTHSSLSFIIHDQLSHVSMDLMSVLRKDPKAECVARELGSREFLESVARSTFYFSPYGEIKSSNKNYEILQHSFFSRLSDLDWIRKVSIKESHQISEEWQSLKIKIQTPF